MTNSKICIDVGKCVGCGLCASVCPAGNIEVKDGKAGVLSDDCIKCGHCGAVCPQAAIAVGNGEVYENTAVRLDPAQVLDVIRFRRSVRRFAEKQIPANVIGRILEAGRLTHTAKNSQDVSFVVLDQEKERLEKYAVNLFAKLKPFAGLFDKTARRVEITEDFFFFRAPVVIVVLARDKTNGVLAAQNMEFVAEAEGLGVLFSGFFTIAANLSRKIRTALQIPRGKKVAATLVLGYPKVKFLRSVPRKKADVRYM